MKPRLFPTHFNLVLDEHERTAFDDLYDRDPHLRDEVELVHRALKEGIKVLNEKAERRLKSDPWHPTRTELAARATGSRDPVENYVGFPIQERVRRHLEDFLATCPDSLSDEEACQMLIDLGLEHAAELPAAAVVANARRAGSLRTLLRLARRTSR